jgi:hypothetical protein
MIIAPELRHAYLALAQEKHARMAKARELAKEAAFRDLPRNEQVRYVEFAYHALKQVEKERTN